MSEQLTGAEIVFKALNEHGVDHIFGYPGGAVLPLYDQISKEKNIKHILVRHEQGAGHAAEGYARSSGKPGIALVTSGPVVERPVGCGQENTGGYSSHVWFVLAAGAQIIVLRAVIDGLTKTSA